MDRILHTTQGNTARGHYSQNQVTLHEDAVVDVISVRKVSGYLLDLRFSDGHEICVDFKTFLDGSRNPHIRRFLEQKMFDTFRIENGDLVWGDYDLSFPMADLYEGRI